MDCFLRSCKDYETLTSEKILGGGRKVKSEKEKNILGTSPRSFLVAGVGLEPHDLRVMSPTSYQLLHPAI